MSASISVSSEFNRQEAILVALESERLRRQVVAALQNAATANLTGELARQAGFEIEARLVVARERLADYLKVDTRTAQVLLYALGWPWLGAADEGQSLGEFTSTGSLWPLPLAGLAQGRRTELAEAAGAAVAWPAAQQELADRFGLTDAQVSAVQGHMCRAAVLDALSNPKGMGRAEDALAKYAALGPAQAEALLAMAGALALVRAGHEAVPALELMARDRADLAGPLLRAAREGLPAEATAPGSQP
jgi:hypothetical protein